MHTSHEPEGPDKPTSELCHLTVGSAAAGSSPCCRPGAGPCSCSHPAGSGPPSLGGGGWLDNTTHQTWVVIRQRFLKVSLGSWTPQGTSTDVTSKNTQLRSHTQTHSPTVPLCPLSAATIRAERPLTSTALTSDPWRSTCWSPATSSAKAAACRGVLHTHTHTGYCAVTTALS